MATSGIRFLTPTAGASGSSGLPAATANADGSISCPPKSAPPGTDVTFLIEGYPVGTAKAAADGSAILTTPLYPASSGAAVSYGALATSPAVSAPGTPIPAFSGATNYLPAPNALTQSPWAGTGVNGDSLTAPTSKTTRWVIAAGDTSNRSLYQNPMTPPIGTVTFGATIVRNSGDASSYLRMQTGGGQAPVPTVVTGTPYRTSLTFTSDGSATFGSINKPAGLPGGDYTIYNVCLVPGSVDPYQASDPPATVPLPQVDYAQQFAKTPNAPTDAPFTNQAIRPRGLQDSAGNFLGYLTLKSGAVNTHYYDFTKTGNCNTRAILDKHFFYNYFTGYFPNENLTYNPSNVFDGVDGFVSYARARRFPPGHPLDLHKLTDKGLLLDVCGVLNDQKPYRVWSNNTAYTFAAMIRLQAIFRPGMIQEALVQTTTDPEGWPPVWNGDGTQISPGRVPQANGKFDYSGTDARNGRTFSLMNGTQWTSGGVQLSPYHEHDGGDNFTPIGKPVGQYMAAGWVYRSPEREAPETIDNPYCDHIANSNGWSFATDAGMPFKTSSPRLCDAIHSMVTYWPDDGSNYIYFIVNGILVQRCHVEYFTDTFYNVLTQLDEKRGLTVMLGGQYGRGFTNQNPITPSGTKGLLVAGVNLWVGDIDLSSVVIPSNGLTPYATPVDFANKIQPTGSAWTSNVTGHVGGTYETDVKATIISGAPAGLADPKVDVPKSKVVFVSSDGSNLTYKRTITSQKSVKVNGTNTNYWITTVQTSTSDGKSTFAFSMATTGAAADTAVVSGTFSTATPKVTPTQTPHNYANTAQGVKTVMPVIQMSAAPTQVPANQSATISGTPQQGEPLTANTTWSNSPTSIAYQWYANGNAVSGETKQTFVPGYPQVGQTITFTATATNGIGPSQPATSAATSAVVSANVTPAANSKLASGSDFTAWTMGATTVTADNVMAPDGTMTADTILPTTASAIHRVFKSVTGLTSGTTYRVEGYAKIVGGAYGDLYANGSTVLGQEDYNLRTGAIVHGVSPNVPAASTEFKDFGDGWKRVRMTMTANATSGTVFLQVNNASVATDTTFAGDGTSGLALWGWTVTPVA